MPRAPVFGDRAFSRRPRPDPAPEDLRVPDRARLLRKKRAAAPDPPYPYFFRNRAACWIGVFLPVRRDAGRPARRHAADPLVRADVVVDEGLRAAAKSSCGPRRKSRIVRSNLPLPMSRRACTWQGRTSASCRPETLRHTSCYALDVLAVGFAERGVRALARPAVPGELRGAPALGSGRACGVRAFAQVVCPAVFPAPAVAAHERVKSAFGHSWRAAVPFTILGTVRALFVQPREAKTIDKRSL